MIDAIIEYLKLDKTWSGNKSIPTRLLEHLEYSGIALGMAILIALPLGLVIGHTGKGAGATVAVANALRSLPTIGLLYFFVVLISTQIKSRGDAPYLIPTLVVLLILAIPSILANTVAGMQNVSPNARDAAVGMGMTGSQVLFKVELPCSLPLIISGIRSATLQVIATATIAASVPLGGLGRLIYDGLGQGLANKAGVGQMATGAILVALLAIGVDLLLGGLGKLVISRGITGRYKTKAFRGTSTNVRSQAEVSAS